MQSLSRYFLVVILLLLGACDGTTHSEITVDPVKQTAAQGGDEKIILRFGFDVRSGAIEDARQYAPFLKYLEKTTGYQFKLHLNPDNTELSDDLGNGIVDLAAVGAVSFIKAERKYAVICLVRGINLQGRSEYRSFMIAHPASDIRGIKDVRGKRMVFGNTSSTQGYLLPRIELMNNGIRLKDLKSYIHTGSHHQCAEEVISGRHDVCGMQDTLADVLEKKGKVRIIHRSDYVPSSGIAINKNVPEHIREKIKQALLDFQPTGRDASDLYNWHKTEMPNGFTHSNKHDFNQLKELLELIQ
ncbi:MAG: phosphate/phosphite/phosphonate ABC transporter substrate-binding protein [Gammaproteobacteria bacterium]|nr:phosphate/phosphite/phosphonate ABC transporter substrate-binding protein [Gammaproteobacteria bacterium]MDH5593448.1 phosphate/phosphite/phosphonate ABC transporter substrate-binding protein [Gammaproteobacteria bacterium]MDH5613805.1 phosphate/phosphite/phosphonate ABC transporter substrate-binding protein [Gammaproteobacteria bacterium]